MTHLRISDAAALLGISDDTLRRWIDAGRLDATADEAGRKVVAGVDLARLTQELHEADDEAAAGARRHRSARNEFTGLVTEVLSDTVMSQVTLQCGRFRVVSLISTEAVREMRLEPGSVASAIVKATNVGIATPQGLS